MNREEKETAIRNLRSQGMSYQKISDALNLDKSYVWRICNGKDTLRPRQRIHSIPPALSTEQMAAKTSSLTLGCLTEMQVAIRLTTLKFEVWTPFIERQRSDLSVRVDNRLVRIQVKTATYDEKNRRFRVSLTTKNGHGQHVPYRHQEFEFFIIKCFGLEEYYVLPFEVGGTARYLNLYPNREPLLDRGYSFEQYRNAFDLLRRLP
jgi:transcriptional regulator with XRE-family HTH domain